MKTYFLIILLCLQISEIFAQGQKFTQTGTASYYAGRFHGRKTASGEIYDSKKLTAAHRTLKFGTMVKVTNLKNNLSVIVKVNDRGPFAHNRIIDISQAAAKEIGMLKTGTTQVRIEVVGENGKLFEPATPKEPQKDTTSIAQNTPKPTPTSNPTTPAADTTFLTGNTYSLWGTKKSPKGMGIQVGSYGDLENAKDLCKDLHKVGIQETYIQVGWSEKRIYRVLVGAFTDEETGKKQLDAVRKAGFDGFVKKHFD